MFFGVGFGGGRGEGGKGGRGDGERLGGEREGVEGLGWANALWGFRTKPKTNAWAPVAKVRE